jgi:hypothetical protein
MESQAGQPARDSTDATTPVPGKSFSHEELARIRSATTLHLDIDRGRNGCFGFRTCGVRGCFKCVAHRTDEYLGKRSGRHL